MYWFTADEHYGHKNIIQYCNRPFSSIEEMDIEVMNRHNQVVREDDVVIHAGDFTMISNYRAVMEGYISKLNGTHIFLVGNHDGWLPKNTRQIWVKTIEQQPVTVCHYAMRVWPKSHYGSFNLFGHSHGRLEPQPRQMDVGVDTNDFYPYSWEEIKNKLTPNQGTEDARVGCDAYINNPEEPVDLEMTCYCCRERVNPERPIEGHDECTLLYNGRLAVLIDQNNLEMR